MSHEVETMAFANKTPWHGLGTRVDTSISTDAMLKAAGLDWKVEQFPLFAQVGLNGKPGSQRVKLPNRQALIRMSDMRVLDVTGKNWKPLQNSDVMDFFREYCEAGQMTLETAGSLRGGQIVWALAKLNENFNVSKGDRVKGYVLLVSPHQVGKSITGQTTAIRVVCANTLALARQAEAQYTQHHLKYFDPESAKRAIGIAHNQMKQFELDAKTLHNMEMSEVEAVRFLAKFFQPTTEKLTSDEEDYRINDLVLKPETRSKVFTEVMAAYEDAPGAEPGSAWGVLNATTYWADHVAGREADARLYRSWFGKNGRTVADVKEGLLELAK